MKAPDCGDIGFRQTNTLLVDTDLEDLLRGWSVHLLAGRAIALRENHFIDLINLVGGPGSIAANGDPMDLRRGNLRRLRYRLGGHGDLQSEPPEEFQADFAALNVAAKPANSDGGIEPFRLHSGAPCAFLPLAFSEGVANISLDSIHNDATLLTLSHWPNNHTPELFKANLSTESVLRYIEQSPEHPVARTVVTDHFDLDGLASVYAFMDPEYALEKRELLLGIARWGDFSRGDSLEATCAALALMEIAKRAGPAPGLDRNARLRSAFAATLPRMRHVLANMHEYESLYAPGIDSLRRAELLLSRPDVSLEEEPGVDMAIFRLPESNAMEPLDYAADYFGLPGASFHNRSKCGTIVLVHGGRIEVRQRYETWVERVCGIPRSRRDLSIFRRALQEAELADAVWKYDGVEHIMPSLKLRTSTASTHSVERVLAELSRFLECAPPAWEPTLTRAALVD
jgi:hypothetical protein